MGAKQKTFCGGGGGAWKFSGTTQSRQRILASSCPPLEPDNFHYNDDFCYNKCYYDDFNLLHQSTLLDGCLLRKFTSYLLFSPKVDTPIATISCL